MGRNIFRGKISTNNSTTVSLTGAATYTGTWEEVTNYGSISIIGTADVAGTLWADFSTDASTLSRSVQISDGLNGAFGIHNLIPIAKFFRIRCINGAGAQSSFRRHFDLDEQRNWETLGHRRI